MLTRSLTPHPPPPSLDVGPARARRARRLLCHPALPAAGVPRLPRRRSRRVGADVPHAAQGSEWLRAGMLAACALRTHHCPRAVPALLLHCSCTAPALLLHCSCTAPALPCTAHALRMHALTEVGGYRMSLTTCEHCAYAAGTHRVGRGRDNAPDQRRRAVERGLARQCAHRALPLPAPHRRPVLRLARALAPALLLAVHQAAARAGEP
jgi:hypothetical protein